MELYAGSRLESEVYQGQRAVCLLLKTTPDPLNPRPQPMAIERAAGVVCGYYFSGNGACGDSASRLLADLAIDGAARLAHGDGVFAFAFWDSLRECLTAGVDKLGMRPLYWAALPGGGYAIASQIKALAGLMDDLQVNWAAWEEQLTFGFLFGEHTFFAGIQRFAPAECITFEPGGATRVVVEDFLATIDIAERPLAAFLDEQADVFDAAMTRLAGLYDAPNQTMLTLTGGYDSRRALGWLLNQDIHPPAYTVPEIGEDGREFESAIVRELCRVAHLQGYTISPPTVADRFQVGRMRDLATDFESDEHNFSTILAMGLDCPDKVNYDGLAAGSQLSGAFVKPAYFESGGDARFLADLPPPARDWLALPKVDAPPLAARVRSFLQRWDDHPNRFAYFYLLSRTRREVALAPLSIQAHVFESLCPYLDRAMMRSALSFPPAAKLGAELQMRLITALHPALGSIPTVYSPGIADNADYRIKRKPVDYRARLAMLRKIARCKRTGAAWSFSLQQRLRFQAAGALGRVSHNPRLYWEIGKGERASQLAHFQQASRDPKTYAAAMGALKAVLGRKSDWCQAL
jgi:hypothetical protein